MKRYLIYWIGEGYVLSVAFKSDTEEGALRWVADRIARDLPVDRCVLLATEPLAARYAGGELRQRATNLLNRAALVAFLAGRPYVFQLYESINERDGVPHYTVIVDEIDHETERPLFGFLGEVFRGHPGVYAEMTVLRESECGDVDRRYSFGASIPLRQEAP